MREKNQHNPRGDSSQRRYTCEVYHLFGGTPCAKAAKEEVDSLLLCERHALEAKLEGQISCWEEMLFHIELWSREAACRERGDVVEFLEVQRVEASSARHRAYSDLDVLRSETPWEHRAPPTRRRRGSLLLLPPKAARPLSLGLGRPRRR
jgi:hypothetical protein